MADSLPVPSRLDSVPSVLREPILGAILNPESKIDVAVLQRILVLKEQIKGQLREEPALDALGFTLKVAQTVRLALEDETVEVQDLVRAFIFAELGASRQLTQGEPVRAEVIQEQETIDETSIEYQTWARVHDLLGLPLNTPFDELKAAINENGISEFVILFAVAYAGFETKPTPEHLKEFTTKPNDEAYLKLRAFFELKYPNKKGSFAAYFARGVGNYLLGEGYIERASTNIDKAWDLLNA